MSRWTLPSTLINEWRHLANDLDSRFRTSLRIHLIKFYPSGYPLARARYRTDRTREPEVPRVYASRSGATARCTGAPRTGVNTARCVPKAAVPRLLPCCATIASLHRHNAARDCSCASKILRRYDRPAARTCSWTSGGRKTASGGATHWRCPESGVTHRPRHARY